MDQVILARRLRIRFRRRHMMIAQELCPPDFTGPPVATMTLKAARDWCRLGDMDQRDE